MILAWSRDRREKLVMVDVKLFNLRKVISLRVFVFFWFKIL